MSATPYTYGTRNDGGANAVFDRRNRIVCTFPPDRPGDDKRPGSPSRPEETLKNAKMFVVAFDLLRVAEQVENSGPIQTHDNEPVTITISADLFRELREVILKAKSADGPPRPCVSADPQPYESFNRGEKNHPAYSLPSVPQVARRIICDESASKTERLLADCVLSLYRNRDTHLII
ncbi:MAG: hypothetical protein IT576_02135 [Verrucomicrobiales bacterium]|nr:hypothetical protein [Verrucomicrobiales bacterium]